MTRRRKDQPEHGSWRAMRERCLNPRSAVYDRYGGRGIRVCDRWASFETFLADMGPKPSAKYTIERIDNNGNYEPGNCRWATRQEQAQNTARNTLLTLNGETMCLTEWSRKLGISIQGLLFRMKAGWPVERVLSPERTCRRGSEHGSAKLTEAGVAEIRSRLSRGDRDFRGMGREYGVTPNMIRHIHQGKAWRHVMPEGEPTHA